MVLVTAEMSEEWKDLGKVDLMVDEKAEMMDGKRAVDLAAGKAKMLD